MGWDGHLGYHSCERSGSSLDAPVITNRIRLPERIRRVRRAISGVRNCPRLTDVSSPSVSRGLFGCLSTFILMRISWVHWVGTKFLCSDIFTPMHVMINTKAKVVSESGKASGGNEMPRVRAGSESAYDARARICAGSCWGYGHAQRDCRPLRRYARSRSAKASTACRTWCDRASRLRGLQHRF